MLTNTDAVLNVNVWFLVLFELVEFEEYGCTEEVLNVVKKFVKTTNSEIQVTYNNLWT